MKFAQFVAVVLLAGCANNYQWASGSGKSQQQYYADVSRCESISQELYAGGGYIPPGQRTNKRRFETCMKGEGWYKFKK
jgi:hypothetical protein